MRERNNNDNNNNGGKKEESVELGGDATKDLCTPHLIGDGDGEAIRGLEGL